VSARTRETGHSKSSKNETTEEAFSVEEMVVDIDRERRVKQKRQSTLSFRPRGEESEEEEEEEEKL
jgi:hypothetical protein